MSLIVGQRMVRADDGMRGVVELIAVPGFEHETERRIVYTDRGERRIAGKRETWNREVDPPRKLRAEEIQQVAVAADTALRAIDRNEPDRWWRRDARPDPWHDPGLRAVISDYLSKRG